MATQEMFKDWSARVQCIGENYKDMRMLVNAESLLDRWGLRWYWEAALGLWDLFTKA